MLILITYSFRRLKRVFRTNKTFPLFNTNWRSQPTIRTTTDERIQKDSFAFCLSASVIFRFISRLKTPFVLVTMIILFSEKFMNLWISRPKNQSSDKKVCALCDALAAMAILLDLCNCHIFPVILMHCLQHYLIYDNFLWPKEIVLWFE